MSNVMDGVTSINFSNAPVDTSRSIRNLAAVTLIVAALSVAPAAAITITNVNVISETASDLALESFGQKQLSRRSDLIALAQIRDMMFLDHGWAGEYSAPLSATVYEAAARLIQSLAEKGDFAIPHIGLSNDGELTFYWNEKGSFLDLGLDEDGKRSAYGRTADGFEFFEDDAEPHAPINSAFMKLIEKASV